MALLRVTAVDDVSGIDKVLAEPAIDKKTGQVKMVEKKKSGKVVSTEVFGNAVTTGLTDWQVDQVKERVRNIRRVDGETKMYLAKELYDLRGLIRGNRKGENPSQWTALKNSGLLPFSPREITDLCGSWEYMEQSGLAPEYFNTVGFRTLHMLANIEDKGVQQKLTGMLAAGEQVTRDKIKKELNPNPTKTTQQLSIQQQVTKKKEEINKYKTEVLREKFLQLYKKSLELEESKKDIQKRFNESLMINPPK